MADTNVKQEIDARGSACPGPLMELIRGIKASTVGESRRGAVVRSRLQQGHPGVGRQDRLRTAVQRRPRRVPPLRRSQDQVALHLAPDRPGPGRRNRRPDPGRSRGGNHASDRHHRRGARRHHHGEPPRRATRRRAPQRRSPDRAHHRPTGPGLQARLPLHRLRAGVPGAHPAAGPRARQPVRRRRDQARHQGRHRAAPGDGRGRRQLTRSISSSSPPERGSTRAPRRASPRPATGSTTRRAHNACTTSSRRSSRAASWCR